MIRRSVFTFTFALIAISFVHLTAQAQELSYIADTGVIDLAPGQAIRVSVAGSGAESVTVRFKKMEYVEIGSIEGLVRKQVGSQTTSGPVILSGDQCLVFYLVASGAGSRVQVLSSSQNLKANAFVISPAPSGGSSNLPADQISLNFTKITYERW